MKINTKDLNIIRSGAIRWLKDEPINAKSMELDQQQKAALAYLHSCIAFLRSKGIDITEEFKYE